VIRSGSGACRGLAFVILTIGQAFVIVTPVKGQESTPCVVTIKLVENTLHVNLENRGTQSIRLYVHDLPWLASSPFLIAAVDESGSVLKQVRPIADPGTVEQIIKPGQHLQGTIPLDQPFPELAELSTRTEVIVFWS
jgi:hypothetical protein